MLSDLAALTPPFLVCAAFLIAVVAFLRHEMRGVKNSGDDEQDGAPSSHDYAEVSGQHSAARGSHNLAGARDPASRTEAARGSEPD